MACFGSLLAGCKPACVPNRQHVPLLKEKGAFAAALNARNLQLAYSPLPGLGVMANGIYRQRSGSGGPYA